MKRVKDLSDKHKEPFLPQAAGVNAFFARKFDSKVPRVEGAARVFD
jgi:hypothetical protein